MNQNEILAKVRLRLDEATDGVGWTDPELRGYINEGFRDIARRTETIQVSSTISAVAGTQEYTLPADITRLHHAEYRATGSTQVHELEYQDFKNLNAVAWTGKDSTQGTPSICTMWGYPPSLKLIVYPKPSLAGTITFYYYSVPPALATDGSDGTDTIPVPTGWEDLVVEYATYLAFRRDQNDQWQGARLAYEDSLQRMIDMTRQWSDQAGGGITGSFGNLPAWLVGSDDW